MAENFAYSLSIGAEFNNEKMAQELQKIKEFVNKSSNEANIEIKALIDQEGIEKQFYNTRDLLNKISGEKSGTIEIFKFGDQFLEVQKDIDGVISSVEKMSQSMRRIQGDIEPIDNLDKRFQNVIEKVHQLNNIEHRSFVNQDDLDKLNTSAKKLQELNSQIKNLNASKEAIGEKASIVKNYQKDIDSLVVRLKDVKSTNEQIAATQKQLNEAIKNKPKDSESLNNIKKLKDEIKELTKQAEKSSSVIDRISTKLKDTKIPEFQGNTQNQIDSFKSLERFIENNKEQFKEIGKEINLLTTESKELMNGMEVSINKVTNSSKDYKTTLNELTGTLQSQYKEAANVQKALNTAYSSGNETAVGRLSEQIKNLNSQIKQTKTEITKLTGNNSIQKNLSADYSKDYDNAKANEKYAKEEAAIKQLDTQLKQLILTKVELAKAENSGASEEYIQYLKKMEASLQSNIDSMTAGSAALKKHSDDVMKDAKNTIQSAEAQARDATERRKNSQILNEYKSKLQELVKQKVKENELNERMKNNSSQRTAENEALLQSYRRQISAIENKLSALKQEAKGSQTVAQMEEMHADAQGKLEQAILETSAVGKKQVNIFTNIAQGMKEAAARVVNYTLAFSALNKAWQFVRNSVAIVKELNDAMTDVQMVTGQSAEQTAEYATQLSSMAEGLGATTTEVAKAATE